MDRQTDALLFTFRHGFAGRLIGVDGHQSDLARRSLDAVLIHEQKVHLLHHFENRLRLKRGTVQPMLNLGEEPRIQGLRVQTPENLAVLVADAHGPLLSGTQFCTYYKR